MLTVKICRNVQNQRDIRRLQIASGAGLFMKIAQAASSSFGFPADQFRAFYVDDENDHCCVSGEDEMLEAVRFFSRSKKVIKFQLDLFSRSSLGSLEFKREAEEEQPAAPEKAPEKQPSVAFVKDVTLPDGCEARGNISKTWRIKNNGGSQWPKGSMIVMGEDFKAPIPCAGPGDECDVTVAISLPDAAGRFKNQYHLHANPAFTGDTNLWVDVRVLPACKPSALFVKDIMFENETNHAPGQWVTKTWEFKNDGKAAWPADSVLSFVSGRFTPKLRQVPLPEAKVGENVMINVNLRTPSRPGKASAVFTLQTADGKKFENNFKAWCSVTVRSEISKDDFLHYLPFMMKDPNVMAAAEKLLGVAPGHQGIHCDECKVSPIRGIRYKCTVCPDFDLCIDCEAKTSHPSDHVFLKLRHPLSDETVDSLLHRQTQVDQAEESKAIDSEAKGNVNSEAKVNLNSEAKVGSESASVLMAEFVDDITIPDGFQVPAGSTIRKTWRIKNTGKVAWPQGASLRWVRGLRSQQDLTLVSCGPGATTDVSVDIVLPEKAGRYTGHFRIATSDGRQFGDNYFLDVITTELNIKQVAKQATKQAKQAKKQANKQAKRAVKDAKQAFKQATKDAKKQARHSLKQVEKQAKKQAKKEATQAVKDATKQAQKQAKQAFSEARKQAKQAVRMQKEAKRAAKQATKVTAKKSKKEAKALKADFVADVSIADGSIVHGGTVFTKTWRIKNAGSVAWPEGSELIWVRGNLTPASDSPIHVACAPGTETDISVDVKAPNKLGRSTGDFRLAAPSGRRFGGRLWADVIIDETVDASKPEYFSSSSSDSESSDSDSDSSGEYQAGVDTLVAMGFQDHSPDMLRSLLGAAHGNVETVVDWLSASRA